MIPIIILTIEDEDSRRFMIRLYEKSHDLMYTEAKQYLACDADIEDAVSTALVKLVDKVDRLQKLEVLKQIPYVITTVRHEALRILGRKKRLANSSYEDLAIYVPDGSDADTDEAILKEQRNRRLKEILGALPQEERLLLEEKYILLRTDAEIAASLGIKPDSVRMRITRAKRKMAKVLTEQGFVLNDWF